MVIAYALARPGRLPRLPPRLPLVRPPDRRRRRPDRPHPRPLPLQRPARLRRPPLHSPLPRRPGYRDASAPAPAGRSWPSSPSRACSAPRPGSSRSPTWPTCCSVPERPGPGSVPPGPRGEEAPLDRADTQSAGLIRPALGRARGALVSPPGAALVGLALAAPILWALFDWITAGSPTYSFTGTQETVETLKRQTGPVDLVLYGPRRLGEVLQWPGMVGALGGVVLGFAFLRRRSTLGLVAAALALGAFALLGSAGLAIIARYTMLGARDPGDLRRPRPARLAAARAPATPGAGAGRSSPAWSRRCSSLWLPNQWDLDSTVKSDLTDQGDDRARPQRPGRRRRLRQAALRPDRRPQPPRHPPPRLRPRREADRRSSAPARKASPAAATSSTRPAPSSSTTSSSTPTTRPASRRPSPTASTGSPPTTPGSSTAAADGSRIGWRRVLDGGGFKRSGLFGLIGVVVVMIAVALIALNADSADPNPKGTMALIFGVIAVFVVILFVLQRSDLERVAGGDAKAVAARRRRRRRQDREPDDDGGAAALGGARDQADRRRGDQGARLDVGLGPAQPEARLGGDAADLPHRAVDLPLRKLRAAADRRAADRDRGDLRQRPRPGAGRRDGPGLREGRAGDGAARLRGDRAAGGQHRGARSDDGPGRPEDPRRPGAERRAPRAPSRCAWRRLKRGNGAGAPPRVQAKSTTADGRGRPEGIVVTRKGGEQADWLCDLWLAERLADAA